MKTKNRHRYVLPNGEIVNNQLEGCIKLGIGRNAFRNRVKSRLIEKVMITERPKGFYERDKANS